MPRCELGGLGGYILVSHSLRQAVGQLSCGVCVKPPDVLEENGSVELPADVVELPLSSQLVEQHLQQCKEEGPGSDDAEVPDPQVNLVNEIVVRETVHRVAHNLVEALLQGDANVLVPGQGEVGLPAVHSAVGEVTKRVGANNSSVQEDGNSGCGRGEALAGCVVGEGGGDEPKEIHGDREGGAMDDGTHGAQEEEEVVKGSGIGKLEVEGGGMK